LDEDLKKMNLIEDKVHFTPAKFDNIPYTNSNLDHKYITTSTNNFQISWLMKDIIKAYENFHNSEVNYANIKPLISEYKFNIIDQKFNFESSPDLVIESNQDSLTFNRFLN
jgi:hypothetical protein